MLETLRVIEPLAEEMYTPKYRVLDPGRAFAMELEKLPKELFEVCAVTTEGEE